MRRELRALLGCGLVMVTLAGCGPLTKPPRWASGVRNISAGQESLTQSSDDHYQSVYSIHRHDGRALVEDMDMISMTDRPSRLTRRHDR